MVTSVALSGEVGVVRHLRNGQATDALLRLKRVLVLGRALGSILTGRKRQGEGGEKVARSIEFRATDSRSGPALKNLTRMGTCPTRNMHGFLDQQCDTQAGTEESKEKRKPQ
jgi:hypothetical protein